MTDLIAQTVDTLRETAAAKRITLRTTASEELPLVWADPGRTTQVLTNLIENAIKFTPADGTVTVRAQVFESDPRFVCIAVADTGCGISLEHHQRIFDRLFQTSSSSERRAGLGLGLYISRELVLRQGGHIWMESELGQGSTFYFTLPIFSLAGVIAPLLTWENVQREAVSLVAVDFCPTEECQLTPIDQTVVSSVQEVLKRCIRRELDLLLPNLTPANPDRVLLIVAYANQEGVEILVKRIREQLGSAAALQRSGIEYTVSSRTVNIPAPKSHESLEQRISEVAARIESLVYTRLQRKETPL